MSPSSCAHLAVCLCAAARPFAGPARLRVSVCRCVSLRLSVCAWVRFCVTVRLCVSLCVCVSLSLCVSPCVSVRPCASCRASLRGSVGRGVSLRVPRRASAYLCVSLWPSASPSVCLCFLVASCASLLLSVSLCVSAKGKRIHAKGKGIYAKGKRIHPTADATPKAIPQGRCPPCLLLPALRANAAWPVASWRSIAIWRRLAHFVFAAAQLSSTNALQT